MGLLNNFQKNTPHNLIEDVVHSLSALFNTKQNFGAWQKQLGLRDYSNAYSFQATVEEITADLQYNIQHYEPRLQSPQIKLISTVFPLCFEISCQLQQKPQSFYVYFNQRAVHVKTQPL